MKIDDLLKKVNLLDKLNLLGKLFNSGHGFVPEPNKKKKVIFNYHDEKYYSYDKCVKKSKLKIDVDTIIIKFSKDTWYGNPKEWYNDDNYIDQINNKKCVSEFKKFYAKYKVLEKINSKKYIIIVKPFMEIHLYRKIKGDDLTIEDILFATRGLCVDHTRHIDSFDILKISENLMVLEPNIDNYSS